MNRLLAHSFSAKTFIGTLLLASLALCPAWTGPAWAGKDELAEKSSTVDLPSSFEELAQWEMELFSQTLDEVFDFRDIAKAIVEQLPDDEKESMERAKKAVTQATGISDPIYGSRLDLQKIYENPGFSLSLRQAALLLKGCAHQADAAREALINPGQTQPIERQVSIKRNRREASRLFSNPLFTDSSDAARSSSSSHTNHTNASILLPEMAKYLLALVDLQLGTKTLRQAFKSLGMESQVRLPLIFRAVGYTLSKLFFASASSDEIGEKLLRYRTKARRSLEISVENISDPKLKACLLRFIASDYLYAIGVPQDLAHAETLLQNALSEDSNPADTGKLFALWMDTLLHIQKGDSAKLTPLLAKLFSHPLFSEERKKWISEVLISAQESPDPLSDFAHLFLALSSIQNEGFSADSLAESKAHLAKILDNRKGGLEAQPELRLYAVYRMAQIYEKEAPLATHRKNRKAVLLKAKEFSKKAATIARKLLKEFSETKTSSDDIYFDRASLIWVIYQSLLEDLRLNANEYLSIIDAPQTPAFTQALNDILLISKESLRGPEFKSESEAEFHVSHFTGAQLQMMQLYGAASELINKKLKQQTLFTLKEILSKNELPTQLISFTKFFIARFHELKVLNLVSPEIETVTESLQIAKNDLLDTRDNPELKKQFTDLFTERLLALLPKIEDAFYESYSLFSELVTDSNLSVEFRQSIAKEREMLEYLQVILTQSEQTDIFPPPPLEIKQETKAEPSGSLWIAQNAQKIQPSDWALPLPEPLRRERESQELGEINQENETKEKLIEPFLITQMIPQEEPLMLPQNTPPQEISPGNETKGESGEPLFTTQTAPQINSSAWNTPPAFPFTTIHMLYQLPLHYHSEAISFYAKKQAHSGFLTLEDQTALELHHFHFAALSGLSGHTSTSIYSYQNQ